MFSLYSTVLNTDETDRPLRMLRSSLLCSIRLLVLRAKRIIVEVA